VTRKCVKQFSHSTNLIAITMRYCDCYYFLPDRHCIRHPPKCLHPASQLFYFLKKKKLELGWEESAPATVPCLQYSDTMKPAYNGTTRDQNSFCCRQFPFHIGTISLAIKSATASSQISCFTTDYIKHNLMSLLRFSNNPLYAPNSLFLSR